MLDSFYIAGTIEAGTDEAGRGCIAGPVYAAAVILPADFHNQELNDSKQLSRHTRERLREIIMKEAVSWCVASASPSEIDDINILNASILSMHRALDGLGTTPEHIIVDGNRFKAYKNIPFTCFVKGDGRYASIAAASILAATQYPQYGWEVNCGYPTKAHREAVMRYGITPLHRKSFKILPDPELF